MTHKSFWKDSHALIRSNCTMFARTAVLISIVIVLQVIVLVAVDAEIDAHVDKILDEMSAEDDAYGVEPQSTLKNLKSVVDIDDFITVSVSDMPVVIGYFDLATSADEFEIFETLGERDSENYNYGYVTNKAVLEEKKYDSPTVLVYMSTQYFNPIDDTPEARYPNKSITGIIPLKTFIRRQAVPLVGEMTLSNEKLYRNTRLPVVTVFMHIDRVKNPKGYAYVRSRVRRVALAWRDRLNFNIASIKEYRRDMDQKYDLEEAYGKKPIMVGLRDRSTYYPMQGDFTGDALQKFVEDFVAGRLEGNEQFDDYLNKDDDDPLTDVVTFAQAAAAANKASAEAKARKSGKSSAGSAAETTAAEATSSVAETPTTAAVLQGPSDSESSSTAAHTTDQKDKPAPSPKSKSKPKRKKRELDNEVVTLSKLNVKEVLASKKADVFLYIHRKECPQCRQLSSEFRRTANAFKDDGGMIVASLDADVNPIPEGFTVESFPALFFIPANNKKKAAQYTGVRQTGDMIQFLFKQRTTPVGPGSDLFNALQKDKKTTSTDTDKEKNKRKGTGNGADKSNSKSEDVDDDDDDEL